MKENLKGKKEKNRNAGLSIFLISQCFFIPEKNMRLITVTKQRAQRSGDSIIHHILFPNIHVRFWNQTIRSDEVISLI
jgi:hypothetical protein